MDTFFCFQNHIFFSKNILFFQTKYFLYLVFSKMYFFRHAISNIICFPYLFNFAVCVKFSLLNFHFTVFLEYTSRYPFNSCSCAIKLNKCVEAISKIRYLTSFYIKFHFLSSKSEHEYRL